jgi:hypothetical protein
LINGNDFREVYKAQSIRITSRSHGLVLEKQLPLSKQIHVQVEVAKQKKDPEPHHLAIGLLQCQWLVFSTEKIMLLVALPMQETGTCCVNY